MAFTSKLNKIMYEVHLLHQEIPSQDPTFRVFHNEIDRIYKCCSNVFRKTIDMDDLIRLDYKGSISKNKIEELHLDLHLILENVKFLKLQLDIHVKHENQNAFESEALIYSSSDESDSISCTVKTPEEVNLFPISTSVPEQRLYNTDLKVQDASSIPSSPCSMVCK